MHCIYYLGNQFQEIPEVFRNTDIPQHIFSYYTAKVYKILKKVTTKKKKANTPRRNFPEQKMWSNKF